MISGNSAGGVSYSRQGGHNPIRPWINIRIEQANGDEVNIYQVPFRYFKSLTVRSQEFNTVHTMQLQLEDTSFNDLYPVFEKYYKGIARDSSNLDDGGGSISEEPDPAILPDIVIQWGVLGVTRTGASRLLKSPVLKFKLLGISEDLQQDKIVFDIEGQSLCATRLQVSSKEVFRYTSTKDLLQKIATAWCIDIEVDENAPLMPPKESNPDPPVLVVDRQRWAWFSHTVLPILVSTKGTGYYLEYGMQAGDESTLFLREIQDERSLISSTKDSLGSFCSNMFEDPSSGDLCLEWRDFRSRILNLNIDGSWIKTLLWSGISLSNVGLDGTISYAESGTGTPSGQEPTSVPNMKEAQVQGHEDEAAMLQHKVKQISNALATSIGMEIEILGNPELLLGDFYRRAAIRIPLRSFDPNVLSRGNRIHWASGPYRIQAVEHNLTDSSYTTTLSLKFNTDVSAADGSEG